MMRQMQAGGNKALSFGKSRAASSRQQKESHFQDVCRTDEPRRAAGIIDS